MMLLIAGGGNVAFYLARHGAARGHRVHMVIKNKQEAESYTQKLDAVILLGDGTRPEVLAEAEAEKADALIALYPDDWDNLIACQVAKTFFGISRTIPLVNDPENLPLFKMAGVSSTVSAAEILGSIIGQESNLTLIAARLAVAAGQVMVMEIKLEPANQAVGRTLRELNLPADSLIAMVIRGDKFLVPRGDWRLEAEDELLLVCRLDVQEETLHALLGDQRG